MIRKLSVENYKSIEKASMTFEEINVLIGKNGAGKTTLISVINMFMKLANGLNINAVVNSVAPFSGEFFNANVNSRHSKFELVIQTPNNAQYSYSFSIAFGDNDRTRSGSNGLVSFYIDNESLYKLESGDKKELIFQRTGSDATIEVGSSNGINKMPLNVDPSVLVLSTYSQEDAKLVARTLGSYSVIWVDTPQRVNAFDIVSSNDPDLGTIDGVAVNLYLKDKSLFNDAIKAIRSIIPGFTEPEITNIATQAETTKTDQERKKVTNYLVSWSDSQYSRSYGISRMSLSGGNSRVIFLILSLYNSDASSCFVAEEIENGMHLSRIAKMIDQMRMIVKNRRIQLFFTTHNHLILTDLLPKEVIFAKLTEGGSEYIRLTETKEYADVEDDLGRTPSSTEIIESGLLFE